MNNLNQEEIRNVMIPLAAAKPDIYKKGLIMGLISAYLMLLISYFTSGFLTNYILIEIGILSIILLIGSKIYDYIYRCYYEDIIDNSMTGVVIGFSNKLLILSGEEVLKEFDTDEITVRKVGTSERESFFANCTTILECKKNGEIIGMVGVDRLEEFEGLTLTADNSRANEDIQVIYDEDPDEDFDEGDDLNEE